MIFFFYNTIVAPVPLILVPWESMAFMFCMLRNSHGSLLNAAAAQPSFSGLQVSTVGSQLSPALLGTQRWHFRASPENEK